ncbi:hypothetical protein HDU92_005294 [Lobulomyces angularis]|nr:hypothetical protein HDU92_005294 [Lobulomyces angularis]
MSLGHNTNTTTAVSGPLVLDLDEGKDVFETSDTDINQKSNNKYYFDSDEEDDDDSLSDISDINTKIGNNYNQDVTENAEIIKTNLDLTTAQSKFSNSNIDASKADFSDTLKNKKNKNRFYQAKRLPDREEYAILTKNDQTEETSVQKLRRLIFEVQELEEEIKEKEKLNLLKTKNNVDGVEDIPTENIEVHPVTEGDKDLKDFTFKKFLNQVNSLDSELTKISKSIGFNPSLPFEDVELNLKSGGGTLTNNLEAGKSLIHKINNLKNLNMNTTVAENNNVKVDESSKNAVTYELYYTPETAKLISLSKISDLEKRLTNLERLIGTQFLQQIDSSEDSVANLLQTSGSLLGAIDKLDHHLSLLTNPRTLDQVVKKVKGLISEMEQLADLRKKQQFDFNMLEQTNGLKKEKDENSLASIKTREINLEEEKRIDYLFQMLDRLDQVGSVVPQLLGRLHALKSLHTEAALFSESLKLIETEQQKVAENFSNLEDGVQKLTINISENEGKILKNVDILDKRISDLVNRVEKLSSNTL